ncbi:hypothetical protein [Chryseobacterium defluvii]|uniref:DUF4488 domain-containing protein n=1 Tax=Chryseobacterium defluvii TaxID=160396 RepID=A0A495SRN1_9FLAO|nr:hypothetical protein [Chryseobacterium defluvii]RKT02074.1 hypothetical protein BCF58_1307 [Chryseobacterium defluvii]
MKKNLLLFFLMIFGMCFSQSIKDLHGKWSGADEGNKKGIFTFFSDGYVALEFEGLIIDGRNFVIPSGPNQGKIGKVKYSVDFSEKPYKVKLIAQYNNQEGKLEENKFLNGLIEFVGEDELLFYLDFENENLTTIDPLSPNTISLHRDFSFKDERKAD